MATYVSGVREKEIGTSFEYDEADQLQKLIEKDIDGNPLATYSYEYDQNGNRKTITDGNGN